MGRDISGSVLLDPAEVVHRCSLASTVGQQGCIVGAAKNAVTNDRNTNKADELCALVDDWLKETCGKARDEVAGSS